MKSRFFGALASPCPPKQGPATRWRACKVRARLSPWSFGRFGPHVLHLKDVFRKALWGDDQVDDSGELMSHRAAVLSLGISALFPDVVAAYNGLGMEICVPADRGLVHRVRGPCPRDCRNRRGVYEHADQRGGLCGFVFSPGGLFGGVRARPSPCFPRCAAKAKRCLWCHWFTSPSWER